MPSSTVIFYDSGLGGLSHVPEFLSRVPCPRLVYFADTANFPYGRLSRARLEELILANVDALIRLYDPCMIIVACNTASVSALAALRRTFPGPVFVGTVPAIKLAAEFSKTRCIGVIATERTVTEPYIHELALRHAPSCRLETVAASDLVEFVETRYVESTREDRENAVKPSLTRCLAAGCDSLVLACTHFMFLAEEFERLAGGKARVFDSREGVARHAAALYKESCPRDESAIPLRLFLETTADALPGIIPEARRSFIASVGFDHIQQVPAFPCAAEGFQSDRYTGVAR